MKPTPNTAIFTALCLCAFALLKFWFRSATQHDLLFLLFPVQKMVGLVLGSVSVFDAVEGFVFPELALIIDKSCAGFQLWLIYMGLWVFAGFQYIYNIPGRLAVLLLASVGGYVCTIFTNIARILTAFSLNDLAKQYTPALDEGLLHEGIGVFINLCFLILTYLALGHFLKYKFPSSPPTEK